MPGMPLHVPTKSAPPARSDCDLQIFSFAGMCPARSGALLARSSQGEGSMTFMSRRPVEGIA